MLDILEPWCSIIIMPEDNPHPLTIEEEIQVLLDQMSIPSAGHMKDGRLRPDMVNDEIRNKLTGITTKAYVFSKRKERDPSLEVDVEGFKARAVRHLLEIFPNQKDYLRGLVRDQEGFEGQMNIFEEGGANEN